MKINIYKDFQLFDAGAKHKVVEIIDKLKINEGNVILDLTNCLIDYPSTSYLIDFILSQIKTLEPKKELTIIIDLTIDNELLIFIWLFYGSKEFNWIEEARDLEVEKVKEKLKAYLTANSISLNIQLLNDDSSIFKEILL